MSDGKLRPAFPVEMEIGPTWVDLKEYKQGDTV